MQIEKLHSWQLTSTEAKKIQENLRHSVVIEDTNSAHSPKLVAGADISFNLYSRLMFGTVVIMEYPSLKLRSKYVGTYETGFPYIPGYLSFREAPALLNIFEKIEEIPDLLICDGHGIAHPRRLGLACHLGLFLNIPTIGCAKSLLVGEHPPLFHEKGAVAEIFHNGECVGNALRTRKNVKPVFVSAGHKISLNTANKIILNCAPKYRIPEPIRMAHKLVNEYRVETLGKQKRGM